MLAALQVLSCMLPAIRTLRPDVSAGTIVVEKQRTVAHEGHSDGEGQICRVSRSLQYLEVSLASAICPCFSLPAGCRRSAP